MERKILKTNLKIGVVFPQKDIKNYWQEKGDDSLMLAKIRDN